jgi:hypothetical protein
MIYTLPIDPDELLGKSGAWSGDGVVKGPSARSQICMVSLLVFGQVRSYARAVVYTGTRLRPRLSRLFYRESRWGTLSSTIGRSQLVMAESPASHRIAFA